MTIKGISWGIVFFFTFIFHIAIPTYLIFTYWVYLSEYTQGGKPMYTFALIALFFYIVALIVALIYITAMMRAFVQCKNEEGLGISKGVKLYGLISTIIIVSFHIIWYILFNEIFIFTLIPPTD